MLESMNRPACLLPLLLAGLLAAAAAQARPRLYIGTELSTPSSMQVDGQLTGFATDKVRILMDRAEVDYEIEVLPWKRAYMLAQTQANVCIYSTTRIPEREKQFKWVGPTHENDWTLFARADRNFRFTKIDDARPYRIGGILGDVRSELLVSQGYNVDTVHDPLSNPRKLMVNRIDLWVTSTRIGNAAVTENGWTGQIVPVLTFKRTEQYLACNLAVSDALIARLNAVLREMNSEGVSAAIERKYNYAGSTARR
jgi:polar amino acid transport system substrate-binding protein